MCTFVETPDIKILVDAGVALGPRFRLLPHPREYEALEECRQSIRRHAKMVDIVTVSHYHHDHFTPSFIDTTWLASSPREAAGIYRGKTLMVKDARSSTNVSQRRRGWIFQSFCRKIGSKIVVADNKSFEYGSTRLRFSRPLPHGEDSGELGFVLATVVESDSEKLIHASDIQGPMSDASLQFILSEKPSTVIIGGPPSYLAGVKVAEDSIRRGMENLGAIAKKVPLVIADHHLLRSEDSARELSAMSASTRPLGGSLMNAAEYIGKESQFLEARRRTLYKEEPPPRKFVKWTKLKEEQQRQTRPPLKQRKRKGG